MTDPQPEREPTGGATTELSPPAEELHEEARRVYLRTTRALNPGLPHAVDFPDLWS